MHLLVEVIFFSGKRKTLPKNGYRPDIIIDAIKDSYWGVTFIDLELEAFDRAELAAIKFTFCTSHYHQIQVGQTFRIMEGATQVGKGEFLSLEGA